MGLPWWPSSFRFHASNAGGTVLIPGPTCGKKQINNNNKVKFKKRKMSTTVSVYLKKSHNMSLNINSYNCNSYNPIWITF